MRSGLEQLIGLVAVLIVLVPAVAIAMAIMTTFALSYFAATIFFAIGISVKIFGDRFLAYLENKLRNR